MSKELSTEKTMTIKEVAKVFNCDVSTIQKRVRELFPEIIQNGKTTYLTEYQVTRLKQVAEKNSKLGHISEVKTDLEMEQKTIEVMQYWIEKAKSAEGQLKQAKPKIEFYDTVVSSESTTSMLEVSKIINKPGYGRTNLFNFLREKNILNKKNIPYQQYVDRGYFKVIEQPYIKGDKIEINFKTVVYQKGIEFIIKLLKKNEVIK